MVQVRSGGLIQKKGSASLDQPTPGSLPQSRIKPFAIPTLLAPGHDYPERQITRFRCLSPRNYLLYVVLMFTPNPNNVSPQLFSRYVINQHIQVQLSIGISVQPRRIKRRSTPNQDQPYILHLGFALSCGIVSNIFQPRSIHTTHLCIFIDKLLKIAIYFYPVELLLKNHDIQSE